MTDQDDRERLVAHWRKMAQYIEEDAKNCGPLDEQYHLGEAEARRVCAQQLEDTYKARTY